MTEETELGVTEHADDEAIERERINAKHLDFLNGKRSRREREIASAPAFTPTQPIKKILRGLDIALVHSVLGSTVDAESVKYLPTLLEALQALEKRTGTVAGKSDLTASDAQVFSEAARASGVPMSFVAKLTPKVKERMRRLCR